MLLIRCPYCGERPEVEFSYGGEAHIARPTDPAALSDAEWGDFLFMRGSQKGAFRERWVHTHGCRRWFNVLRDTATHEIHATYEVGAPKPDVTSGKPGDSSRTHPEEAASAAVSKAGGTPRKDRKS